MATQTETLRVSYGKYVYEHVPGWGISPLVGSGTTLSASALTRRTASSFTTAVITRSSSWIQTATLSTAGARAFSGLPTTSKWDQTAASTLPTLATTLSESGPLTATCS